MLSYLSLDVNIFLMSFEIFLLLGVLVLPAPVEHLDMVLKRFPAAGLWLRKISNNLQNLRFGKNCRLTKKTLMI